MRLKGRKGKEKKEERETMHGVEYYSSSGATNPPNTSKTAANGLLPTLPHAVSGPPPHTVHRESAVHRQSERPS